MVSVNVGKVSQELMLKRGTMWEFVFSFVYLTSSLVVPHYPWQLGRNCRLQLTHTKNALHYLDCDRPDTTTLVDWV